MGEKTFVINQKQLQKLSEMPNLLKTVNLIINYQLYLNLSGVYLQLYSYEG